MELQDSCKGTNAMPSEPDRLLAEVLALVRDGNPPSGDDFERLLGHLAAAARATLRRRTLKLTSAESVAESALASFVMNGARSPLADPEGLWHTLLASVVRHSEKWNKWARAAKRDPNREAYSLTTGGETSAAAEPGDRESPVAEAGVLLAEATCRLMEGLSGRDQKIAELAMQGLSRMEIGEELSLPYHIVRRGMEAIKDRLRRMEA